MAELIARIGFTPKVEAMFEELKAQVAEAANGVYAERNRLVALLSTRYPSHLCLDPDAEEGWTYVVCVHAPTGQMAWHIPHDDLPLFAHLAFAANHWDGHTTDEKNARVEALIARGG